MKKERISKKVPPETIRDFPTDCKECDGWGWVVHPDFSYSEPCSCNSNAVGKGG